MKRITILMTLLLVALAITAEPVTPAIARQAAQRFLKTQGSQLKSEALRAPGRTIGHSFEGEGATENSTYYVFNASADKGFVVVSGDDCVGDNLILGYTSKGSFDVAAVPANMQWWFDETSRQIDELSRMGLKHR